MARDDTFVEQFAALEKPRMREADARSGDDHGVNLTEPPRRGALPAFSQ
jgi:hypothetical protein